NRDSESVGDFGGRQSVNITQNEGSPIASRKPVDRRREHVPKLFPHRGVIDVRRPVPRQTGVTLTGIESAHYLLQRPRNRARCTVAPVGGITNDAIDPGSKADSPLKVSILRTTLTIAS